MANLLKKVFKEAVLYVFIFIFAFLGLVLLDFSKDKYVIAGFFSLFVVVVSLLISKIRKFHDAPSFSDKGMIRYSMMCKNCNWEWMSNTTDKKSPTRCPNCGERVRLEVIGWRRVQYYQEQKNQELTRFLNKI